MNRPSRLISLGIDVCFLSAFILASPAVAQGRRGAISGLQPVQQHEAGDATVTASGGATLDADMIPTDYLCGPSIGDATAGSHFPHPLPCKTEPGQSVWHSVSVPRFGEEELV